MIIAELQCPQPIVLECMPVGIAQETVEAAAGHVVDSDLAAAGVPDKEVIAIEAEVCRCQCNTPGRIQPRSAFQPLQQLTRRRVLVDKAESWKVEIVMFGCVLTCAGNIQLAVDLLYIERSKPLGNLTIN